MKRNLLFLIALMTMFIMGGRAQTSCPSPATFNATLHVPNWQNVQLNWTAPPTDLKWCGPYSTRIGMNDSADFVGAARFTPENLAGFAGLQINSVTFVPCEAASVCTYTVYIWQGGSIVDDTIFDTGTLIASEVVDTGFTIYQEYTVPLTTPVTVDPTQELWIGIRCTTTAGYPLGASSNGGVFFYGDLILEQFGNTNWENLGSNSSLVNYNWVIVGNLSSGAQLSSYNLYRDDQLLASSITGVEYLDSVDFGTYEYELTAVFDNGCESQPKSLTVAMNPNPCLSCTDTVQVGNGTSTTYYVPLNTFYNYSFTEQIYTAAELGTINGTIPCLAFQYIYGTAQDKNIVIYMGNTTKNSFSGTSDWVPVNNMVKVFEGTVTFTNAGDGNWVYIPLDLAFEYDGASNIVVAVLNNTGSYLNSDYTFSTHSSSGKTLYVQQDGSPYNVNNLPAGSTLSSRNNIRFLIGDPVDCPMPGALTVSNITTEGATVSWNSNESHSGYEYVIVSTGSDMSEGTVETINDTTVTFTELTDGTSYTVYVRANCSSDNSNWASTSFMTICLPLTTLPYTMNFDGMGSGTGTIPDCWEASGNGYPYISTSYHHSGSASLYFYSYSPNSSRIRGQGLDLTENTSPLMMKYYAYKTSAGYGYLQAGYMTDPTDFSTFVNLKTIYSSDFNMGSWYEVKFPLPEAVNGQVIYPVLYCPFAPGSTSNYVYVDDISIYPVDGFCLAPNHLTVTNVTGASALVSWSPDTYASGDEVYTVQYMEVGTDNWQSDTTTSTHYHIGGLDPQTNYVVRVFVDCDNNLYSDTLSSPFTTNCLAGGTLAIGNGTTTSSYLPDYCFYNYCYTQQIFLANELNGAMPITSIAFDAATINTTPRHLSIYLVHTTSASSDWVPATNAQLVYNGSTNLVVGWNTFQFTSPFQYNGTDNLAVIVIDSTGSYSTSNTWNCHTASATLSHYQYQDSGPYSITATPSSGSSGTTSNRNNVIFGGECDSTIVCAAPSLLVEGFTNESVTLSWTPGYQETAWEMEYSETGSDDWTTVVVTSSPVEVDNLDPNTTYTFRLRSVCGGSDVSSWSSVTVSTVCDYIDVPYSQDFEADSVSGAGSMASCWISGTNYTTAYPYITTSYAQSGSRSLYFYGTSSYYSYATLPRFADDVVMDSLVVNFSIMAATATYSIELGVMTNPMDISTFVTLGSYSPGTEYIWKSFEVKTNAYNGNGHYLAFRIPAWGTSYMYLDDITVDYVLPCSHPTNLALQSVGVDEATITWTPGGEETEWEYVYGLAGTVNLTTDPVYPATDAEATLTNLLDNTLYDVYVRAVCSSAEISAWEPLTFRTQCIPFAQLPYTENFDSMSTHTSNYTSGPNNLTDCWEGLTTGTTYTSYPFVYYGSSYANSGSYSLRFYSYYSGSYGDQYAILPPVDVNTLSWESLLLEFSMKNGSTTSPFTLIVGVVEGSDINTFVPVDTVSQASTAFMVQSVGFANYQGNGNRIAIVNKQPSENYSYGQIDDIVISAPSCIHPNHLTAIDADTSSITLSWNERGSATTWILEYGPVGFTPGTGTVIQTTTNPYTVANLPNSTMYDFYVRSLCSSTDTSALSIKTTAHTTMVPTALPYATDFSDPNDAWILNNGSCTNYWVRGNVNGSPALFVTQDGTTAGYSTSSNSMVSAEKLFTVGADATVTIQFDVNVGGESMYDFVKLFLAPPTMDFPASNASISSSDYGYYSYSNYAYNFYANGFGTQSSYPYVMNLTGGSTVHVTAVMNNPISNPNANSTAKLVFVWRNDPSSGTQPGGIITNVQIGDIACPNPTNLTVSNVTLTSADVTWTAGGSETAWTLEYKANSDATWTSVPLTTSSYQLTNLTAATLYDVRVQANCSADDQSIFTTTSFGTLLCNASEQCSYTFNLTDDYGDGWNGGSLDVLQNGILVTNIGMTSGSSATETVLLCHNVPTSLVWHSGSYDDEAGFSIVSPDDTVIYTINDMENFTTYTFTPECDIDTTVTPVDPTVATTAATSIDQTTATLNATITNPDNVTITAKGFEWKTTTGGSYQSIAGTGTGNTFTANLSNLTPNTGYTFKAFITFGGQTVYGSEQTFTTLEQGVEPCNVPTGLHTTDIQNESIAIAWDANADVSSWNIQYRIVNGQLNSASSNTNSYNITGLTGNTDYEIQVQAVCTSGQTSDWSAAITAHTTNVGIVNHLENSVVLFPNPAKKYIDVRIDGDVTVTAMEVYDVYGKLINTVVVTENPTRINVSNLANGMYFVRVTTEEGMVTKTFVKK